MTKTHSSCWCCFFLLKESTEFIELENLLLTLVSELYCIKSNCQSSVEIEMSAIDS